MASAKARHRVAAFRLHSKYGFVVCALRGEPEHRCHGELQAHHSIEVQRLKKLWARAHSWSKPDKPNWVVVMRRHDDINEVIADARNSDVLCEIGHRQIELGRFHLAPHRALRAFAEDYCISHLLDDKEEEEDDRNNR